MLKDSKKSVCQRPRGVDGLVGYGRKGRDRRRAGLLHQLGGLEPVEEGLGILGFQIVEPGGE